MSVALVQGHNQAHEADVPSSFNMDPMTIPIHRREAVHACDKCDTSFIKETNLRLHMEAAHAEKASKRKKARPTKRVLEIPLLKNDLR